MPRKPASAIVGTAGSERDRFGSVEAKTFSLPSLSAGNAVGKGAK